MSDYNALINKIVTDHTTAVKIEKLGGLSQKITQSDKLGYNWVEDYIGETLVKQTYVKQDNSDFPVKANTKKEPAFANSHR